MAVDQRKRTTRATPLPPDRRRTAIIEAVIPVLTERGAGATTRELADAAQVSEGTIFKVFADKQQLIDAVVAHARDTTEFDQQLADLATIDDLVEACTAAVAIIQQRTVSLWRLLSRLPHTPQRATLSPSPALVALFENHQHQLRFEPTEAAQTLRGLTLSMSHPLLAPTPYPPDHIVDVFLNGASA